MFNYQKLSTLCIVMFNYQKLTTHCIVMFNYQKLSTLCIVMFNYQKLSTLYCNAWFFYPCFQFIQPVVDQKLLTPYYQRSNSKVKQLI